MRIVLVLVAACAAVALAVLRPAAPGAPAPAAASWSTPGPQPRASATPRGNVVVYVAGEVVHPGVYTLAPTARVAQALDRAGGPRPSADLIAVNLAAHVRDGDEIVVPLRGAPVLPHAHRTSAPRARHLRTPALRTQATNEAIDVNTASADALAALPGIGPALAARIVAFRQLNGPFNATDELLDVAGITEHRFAVLEPYVVVR